MGVGTSRKVYEIPGHPEAVIKVGLNSNFANWAEFVVFATVGDEEEPFLGTIQAISQSGKYLIMERLRDLTPDEHLPDVPPWLTDIKRSSFGVSPLGTTKVRDYANIKLSTRYKVSSW